MCGRGQEIVQPGRLLQPSRSLPHETLKPQRRRTASDILRYGLVGEASLNGLRAVYLGPQVYLEPKFRP